ncbi:MAG: carbamoyl phosphate synthase small subunit [Clostridiales bacterium]|jgi:carbamoyl-phosphate synthase small subunit|nr:carbamoyl phosphate synthase small subunit [Clostridiales bacterium]
MSKAYLVLENGMIFEGESFGAKGEVVGEVVFTTGVTGYLETLTDPSYHGQLIIQTFPLIGNYGVITEDFESAGIGARGYIVKEWCKEPSNFRNEGDLHNFLAKSGVVGLCGVDTRQITKIIRENGVMNGKIMGKKPERADLNEIKKYAVVNAVAEATSARGTAKKGEKIKDGAIALMDFGAKRNIIRELEKRGERVHVFAHNATAAEILASKPKGIMLSNGPGDPSENVGIIKELAKLIKSGIPIFGICLGHQLLALAHGFATEKLKYGHRGANQPVRDVATGRVHITSQNHGYAVKWESVDMRAARELFVNVNDGTNEGLEYLNAPIFSVQFHPEACGGPLDTNYLFDKFIENINNVGGEVHCR